MRLRAWSASAVGMAAAGLVGWSAARPGPPLAGPSRDEVAAIMARPVGLLPLRSLDLATDRGRRVRTYEFAGAMPEGGDPVELEALFLTVWGAGHRIIRVSGTDPQCNCHGWTFAGGRCWLQSDEAEAILAENGYALAAGPRPGDVVAYRTPDGRVCHTGVVVGVSRGGEVVVESKWAWLGVFVHPAAAQPYAANWGYYRSGRVGNDLTGPARPGSLDRPRDG